MSPSNLLILILCIGVAMLLVRWGHSDVRTADRLSPIAFHRSSVAGVHPATCDRPLIHDASLPCPRGVPGVIEVRAESCRPDKRMGDWYIVADHCDKLASEGGR